MTGTRPRSTPAPCRQCSRITSSTSFSPSTPGFAPFVALDTAPTNAKALVAVDLDRDGHPNVLATVNGAGGTGYVGLASQTSTGRPLHYQFLFRDPQDPCGAGFNATNGYTITW